MNTPQAGSGAGPGKSEDSAEGLRWRAEASRPEASMQIACLGHCPVLPADPFHFANTLVCVCV